MEAQVLSRNKISQHEIDIGGEILMNKIQQRLRQKGDGSFASRHEILGIITEEYDELKDAIRLDDGVGLHRFKQELLDIAVGAIFGYICINSGSIVS